MQTFRLEIDYPNLSRSEFRHIFSENLEEQLYSLRYTWIHDLARALEEIVKNFFDHANKKGVIVINVGQHEMTFEAYDFGPGYVGLSKNKELKDIIAYHKQHGSSLKSTSPENRGIGLRLIQEHLGNMKHCSEIKDSFITIVTNPHFHYSGKITY